MTFELTFRAGDGIVSLAAQDDAGVVIPSVTSDRPDFWIVATVAGGFSDPTFKIARGEGVLQGSVVRVSDTVFRQKCTASSDLTISAKAEERPKPVVLTFALAAAVGEGIASLAAQDDADAVISSVTSDKPDFWMVATVVGGHRNPTFKIDKGDGALQGSAVKVSDKVVKQKCTASSNLTFSAKAEKDPTILVTSVEVSPKTEKGCVGGTVTLSAEVRPENATEKGVTWSSSDTGVATVDANGVVTGVKAGTTAITAKAKDGSGKTDSATVKILSEFDYAKSQIDDLIKDYEKKASTELTTYETNVSESDREEIAEYGKKPKKDVRSSFCMLNLSGSVLSASASAVGMRGGIFSIQLKGIDVSVAGLLFSAFAKVDQGAIKFGSAGGLVEDLLMLIYITHLIHADARMAEREVGAVRNRWTTVKTIHTRARTN